MKKIIGYCVESRYYIKYKDGWGVSDWEISDNRKIYKTKEIALEAMDCFGVNYPKQFRIKPLYIFNSAEDYVPVMKYAIRWKCKKENCVWMTRSIFLTREEALDELSLLKDDNHDYLIEEIIL